MSKYDGELADIQQMISMQQAKQQRLEILLVQAEKKDGQMDGLLIRTYALIEEGWRDKSTDKMKQMLEQSKHYYTNQIARIEGMIQEIQREIERGYTRIADYQNDIQYYTNLKRLEAEANVSH
ncbi:hypothetical protein [Listeria goaensis]|uniref:hypothetical protein n=1 Tax=Listeria goaensis TaxID=1649188 RepID=UPI000B594F37|nr:hypothetical protein [Listeria goaensis]